MAKGTVSKRTESYKGFWYCIFCERFYIPDNYKTDPRQCCPSCYKIASDAIKEAFPNEIPKEQ